MLWPIAIAAALSYSLNTLWPLTALLFCLLLWQIGQKWRLAKWLARGDLLDPPHAAGLWEDYYTRLMHLFRAEQRAQQQLSSIIERARHCADSLNEGILLLNRKGEVEYSNQTAFGLLDMIGDDRGEVLIKLLRNPLLRHYLEEKNFSQPLVIPSPLGGKFLQFRATDLGQDEILLRVEDVSHLQTLESLRKDFVANVSHELKTPLTVFKGYLELLQDMLANSKQPILVESLQNMESQCLRMEALVKDLLLLAKLESSKVKPFQAINIKDIFTLLWGSFKAQAESKKQIVTIDIPDDLILMGLPDEIESAFGNLLGNAIKYTQPNGAIKVEAWRDTAGVHIAVRDNGNGIENRHLAHITERFYRVDESRNSGTGGTGLGLAIVKHVMQRHHARLSIESKVGEGSSFTCTFRL